MKRLIIADIKSYNNNGKSTGHYFAVARNYSELYSDICDVKIAGGTIFNTGFKSEELFCLPYETSSSNSNIKNKWNVLKNARYLFKNTSSDDVIVMQKSGTVTMFLMIALFAKKRKNNIFFIEYDTVAINSPLKRFIYNLAKKKCKGLICPNEKVGKAYDIPYCVVTDYIYSPKANTAEVNYTDKEYDICTVGSIWPDKGVVEVAERFKNTNIKLVIAGKPCDDNIKEKLVIITKNSPNIKLHLGYLSYDDYYGYINNSRYCILNYKGCYDDRSSGVILDILFNHVPVVAHRCNATTFIEEDNSGFLYNNLEELNPNDLLNEVNYQKYLNGVTKFLDKQKSYKEKMIRFLNI